jgi:hypothetical protein
MLTAALLDGGERVGDIGEGFWWLRLGDGELGAAPNGGTIKVGCRRSGSAWRWRHAPLDLAKMEGRVRSGRTSWFQRGRMGERRRCGDGALLLYSQTVSKQRRALPGEGEPGASAGAQGGVVGEVERRLRERAGSKGARGILFGAVASVTGRSGRGALGVHWLGGAVA